MHGGGVVLPVNGGGGPGPGHGYSSEITFTVVMSCLMAASGGLIFGYDISITGQCRCFCFAVCRIHCPTLLGLRRNAQALPGKIAFLPLSFSRRCTYESMIYLPAF